ncbi:MAG: 50S ribosomal protein L7/L12 [Thermodesulfobacteriota bacterium]|nr:50S ribosomal protein L7/L12 [Thermodesulfobacteriota bacterium]
MTEISREEVIKFIENMTVLELSDLIKELEERFGVSASAYAPVGMPVQTQQFAEEAQVEEKTEFDIILQASGEKKIQVIKVVRAVTELGLKEAKELVDNLPNPVKEGISKEEAENIKKQLEEVGATVDIK